MGLLLLMPRLAAAQAGNPAPPDTTVYTYAETMPEYPGGMTKLITDIRERYRLPRDVNQPPGKMMVQFVVSATGQVVSPRIVRSSGYPSCDAEMLRVLPTVATFSPARQGGKPVAMRMTLPYSCFFVK